MDLVQKKSVEPSQAKLCSENEALDEKKRLEAREKHLAWPKVKLFPCQHL